MLPKARAIALFLPQFHPIPENDEWWGKGFTEWTNTAKAKPLFRGHYQPHIPADLGFYDLRVAETREQQAEMARAHGIEGFCYYHYWFGGRRILNRPFDEMLKSKRPDFPFCVCWANETWSGIWHGSPNRTLIQQNYPGLSDHKAHFSTLLPAFEDPRYIRVNGKPLLVIYRPGDLPNTAATLDYWRQMAIKAGLNGIHFVGNWNDQSDLPAELGFDAAMVVPDIKERPWMKHWREPVARVRNAINNRLGRPHVVEFAALTKKFLARKIRGIHYPGVIHAWDNTPRSGKRGVAYINADPEYFRQMLAAAVKNVADHPPEQRIIFLKSWNEWAEGNHLEPDLRYGKIYLEVLRDVLIENKEN